MSSIAALIPRSSRPRVTVESGATVVTWALRAGIAATAAGCTALVATHPLHWVVAAALVATAITRPAAGAGAVFAVGAGLLLLADDPDPFSVRVAALAVGLHLTLELAAITAGLPWTAAVERAVLAAHVRPFLVIQVLTQAGAAAGAWFSDHPTDSRWIPVAAAAGVAALAWGVLLRLRPPR